MIKKLGSILHYSHPDESNSVNFQGGGLTKVNLLFSFLFILLSYLFLNHFSYLFYNSYNATSTLHKNILIPCIFSNEEKCFFYLFILSLFGFCLRNTWNFKSINQNVYFSTTKGLVLQGLMWFSCVSVFQKNYCDIYF